MGKVNHHFLEQDPNIVTIFEALEGQARLVGGCVRDALLTGPIGDIDITTPLVPGEVTARLEKAQIKVIPTGLKFGTVTAVIDSKSYEITTLRKDVACDGRHAEVAFTDDYEEDASRRDFTFNAMSCDLEGNLYDYFNGVEDLQKGIVKFVGDAIKRCQEDYLRILRFFRFYAWFGKNRLDERAMTACTSFAHGVEQLSGERIQKEMLKLLLAYNPITALQAMEKTNVLKCVLGVQVKQWEGLIRQIELEQDYALPILPLVRLAQLMKDIVVSGQELSWLIERWKLSNHDAQLLETLVFEPCLPLGEIVEHYPLVRRYGKTTYTQMLRVQWALDVSSKDKQYNALLNDLEQWDIPIFPLTGKDLQALGIAPGKAMGALLKRAESWWEAESYKPDKSMLIKKVKGWTL